MKYQFIDKYRSAYRVGKMCRILHIGRSSYYAWKRRRKSMRDEENESLVFTIRLVHGKSRKAYGSPRITAQLRARGIRCGKNRVARLMRENGIMAKTKRRFKITTDSKHNLPIAENLLGQDFTADAPSMWWTRWKKRSSLFCPIRKFWNISRRGPTTMNGGSLTCAKSRRSISVKRIRRTFKDSGDASRFFGSASLFYIR